MDILMSDGALRFVARRRAIVLSRMMLRSNSANALEIWKMSLPVGLVVTIALSKNRSRVPDIEH
jgi:hypothetical protein